ncbi:MAG: hypothetical protein AAF598_05085 [Bacteroidota bacterium]
MENSKLILLFASFTTAELRAFKDFVASPYFNKNQELVRFYDYLKKQAPHFPPKKVERSYIWKKLYPGQQYDQKQLNYLMSFLLKLAEQFIGLRSYEQEEILVHYHILEGYIQRKLDKNYQHVYRKTEDFLDKAILADAPYYYNRYLLADIANRYFLSKRVIKEDPTLNQAATFFDHYYLANKLRYCCEQLDRTKLLDASNTILLLEEIKGHLSTHDYQDYPPIAVYYQILMMLLEPENDQHFAQFQAMSSKHWHAFPKEEQKSIHAYALNYSIRKLNRGHVPALEALFQLYNQGIDQHLLIENQELSPWTYKNAIKIGLRLNKFDWVEQFIASNTELLAERFRKNATHYNLAEWHYYKGEHGHAQQQLIQVELNDLYYSLDSRRLLLKIYFETEEDEALWSLLASFRIFLKRNKLANEGTTNAYINFVDLLKKIVKRDPALRASILEQIQSTIALPDRTWLQMQTQRY